jgi:hypothetical protein
MAGEHEKAQLIADIAIARSRIADAGNALKASAEDVKQKLNVSARAKASYGQHPLLWNAGAAVLGFLLSRLPARKKVVYVDRDTGQELGGKGGGKGRLLWGALKFAGSVARPFLSAVATQKFAEFAQRYAAGQQPPEAADEEETY